MIRDLLVILLAALIVIAAFYGVWSLGMDLGGR